MSTCAICGWRDAMTTTAWGTRDVPACSDCAQPVVADVPLEHEPHPGRWFTREQVARVVGRFDGLELRDVAEQLDVEISDHAGQYTRPYMALSNLVARMARAGELVATRTSPRVYTVPKKTRRAA